MPRPPSPRPPLFLLFWEDIKTVAAERLNQSRVSWVCPESSPSLLIGDQGPFYSDFQNTSTVSFQCRWVPVYYLPAFLLNDWTLLWVNLIIKMVSVRVVWTSTRLLWLIHRDFILRCTTCLPGGGGQRSISGMTWLTPSVCVFVCHRVQSFRHP